ncbi:MAG: ABC transporter transmembrane domain-containing protein [Spirochaetales bacterium]
MKQNEEKTKQTVGLKGLWRFLTGYRRTYLAAIVAVAIATLAMYAVPLVLRLIIDSVLGDMPVDFPPPVARFITDVVTLDRLEQNLWIPAVVIVAITAGAGIFQYLQKKWSATASELSAERARNDLYDHLQHLSYDYHVKAETGDLIQRCTSDHRGPHPAVYKRR